MTDSSLSTQEPTNDDLGPILDEALRRTFDRASYQEFPQPTLPLTEDPPLQETPDMSPDALCQLGMCYALGVHVTQDSYTALKYFQQAAAQDAPLAYYCIGYVYEYAPYIERNETLAVEWYKKSALAGNAWGQFALGHCYYRGTGLPQDAKEAENWCSQAAKGGLLEAQIGLGHLYENGFGEIKANKKKAAQWYKKAADRGSTAGSLALAHLAVNHSAQEKDLQEARFWLRQAGEKGDARGYLLLADMLANRWAKSYDLDLALHYYQRAADMNLGEAEYTLGCYYLRDALDYDPTLGLSYLTRAVDHASPEAQILLGLLYEQSSLLPRDIRKAVLLYEQAAAKNNADAVAALGFCYLFGTAGVLDPTSAVTHFRKADALGSLEALWYLNALYKLGFWTPQSVEERNSLSNRVSVQEDFTHELARGLWHLRAAETNPGQPTVFQQIIDALPESAKIAQAKYAHQIGELLTSLGQGYLEERGIQKDYATGKRLLTQAAEMGYGPAQVALAECLLADTRESPNFSLAFSWLTKAFETGSLKAQALLATCYKDGLGTAADPDLALQLISDAVARGSSEAQTNLATCYLQGDLVPKNPERAYELYRLAIASGNTRAMGLLGEDILAHKTDPENVKEAEALLLQAAKAGDLEAQYALGSYRTRCDKKSEGHMWLKKAAVRGHIPAGIILRDFYTDAKNSSRNSLAFYYAHMPIQHHFHTDVSKEDCAERSAHMRDMLLLTLAARYMTSTSALDQGMLLLEGLAKVSPLALFLLSMIKIQSQEAARQREGWESLTTLLVKSCPNEGLIATTLQKPTKSIAKRIRNILERLQPSQPIDLSDEDALRAAARSGNAFAQCALGVLVGTGFVKKKDLHEAYDWLCMAEGKIFLATFLVTILRINGFAKNAVELHTAQNALVAFTYLHFADKITELADLVRGKEDV